MKLVLLLSLVIPAVFGLSCPSAYNNPDVVFGNDFTYHTDAMNAAKTAIESQAEAAFSQATSFQSQFFTKQSSVMCTAPTSYQVIPSHRYRWVKHCEPCRPSARHLWRFHGNRCFVIFPRWQQVRVARCSYRRCASPCGGSITKCLPTEWTRVWFYGWCHSNVGSWKAGLSYHYLYLPQDCTCHRKVFYRKGVLAGSIDINRHAFGIKY
ncbi:uncharacterized protein LOC121376510 [Gigantopelta aegis]|uniref:uncharacterized protein LOC121376510 n=1 Tax=Gigantopelta aegis TaxID=1735272 RepID=UPI001B888896|nr:uncharacterized protein LOC121376510 [Gigantopelta aegis]